MGKTQQRILDELKASEHGNLTVVGLAERLGASARQIRQAVHSLAGRELVVLTKEGLGWQGKSKIGRAVPRRALRRAHPHRVRRPQGRAVADPRCLWRLPQGRGL